MTVTRQVDARGSVSYYVDLYESGDEEKDNDKAIDRATHLGVGFVEKEAVPLFGKAGKEAVPGMGSKVAGAGYGAVLGSLIPSPILADVAWHSTCSEGEVYGMSYF